MERFGLARPAAPALPSRKRGLVEYSHLPISLPVAALSDRAGISALVETNHRDNSTLGSHADKIPLLIHRAVGVDVDFAFADNQTRRWHASHETGLLPLDDVVVRLVTLAFFRLTLTWFSLRQFDERQKD